VPAPAGRGEERISENRAARHAPDSPPSVRSLSSSPSFSSSLLLPCLTSHLQFLDEHFSQQSTWTSSARPVDSPPPTTRWSSRTNRRPPHPLLVDCRFDSRLALSARYRFAAAVSYTRNVYRATPTGLANRLTHSGQTAPRSLHGPHHQQQQHRTPATAPPRPRQRSHTHLRAPAHTCTLRDISSSSLQPLRTLLLGHLRPPPPMIAYDIPPLPFPNELCR